MNDTGRRIAICPRCGKLTILFLEGVQEGYEGSPAFSLWRCYWCETQVSGARFLPAAEEARIMGHRQAVPAG